MQTNSEFTAPPKPRSPIAFAAATLLIGVGAGLGGMLLALLLHWIQHIAFGYSLAHVVGDESFLSGVSAASLPRRFVALTGCGLVAGLGWYVVYRHGRPLVSIRQTVKLGGPPMPIVSTLAHALLQIVTVALGSPLGREVAPREVGAVVAGEIARRMGLGAEDCRILIACGAGAGLAAVYNVPLGATAFVLEVMLGTFAWSALVPAAVTSAIAAAVAWIGLGNEHQYSVPDLTLTTPLAVFAAVSGPVFGAAAFGFTRLTSRARAAAPKDWRIVPCTLVNFAVIGALVMFLPALAGNGKGPATLSFVGALTIGPAAVLLVLKVAIEASTLRAGAEGGLLTPGLTNGALLALVLGGLWNVVWPGTSPGAFAIVGAGAFLAASMQMPLTAILLMVEFTRVSHDFLVPLMLCTGGSVVMFKWLSRERVSAGLEKPERGAVVNQSGGTGR